MLIFRRALQRLRLGTDTRSVNEPEGPSSFDPAQSVPEAEPSNRQLIDGDNLPLSILPEPELYIEPSAAPFERLKTLIDVSDGGVLAVTGERGAGKSMLLRKIADHYAADSDTAQNVVIHLASPVGSARDMDVFVMLFRHLTVTVKNLLLEKGRQASNDIEAIGREAMQNVRQRTFAAAGLLTAVFIGVSGWIVLPAFQRSQITKIERELESAQNYKIEDMPQLAKANRDLQSAQDAVSKAGKATTAKQADQVKIAKQTVENIKKSGQISRENRINLSKEYLQDAKNQSAQIEYYIVFAAAILSIYFIGIPLWISISRRRLIGLNQIERGLLIYSERIERRLDFETTKAEELSFELTSFGGLKTGGKKGASDKARALSLPELTTKYIEYVKQIRRVFPGKIVVCIDELDKITDLEQVRFILREIKGALYVKGSYYILSISTDGLRSFEGRLADGRDIFESTFDDALSIRGLDVESCRSILKNRMGKLFSNSGDDGTKRIITLISVLSGGNTRELIRTFREWVLLERQLARPVLAEEVWLMFLTRRIQAMIDRLSAPNASLLAADFTVLLEAIKSNPEALYPNLERLTILGTEIPILTATATTTSDVDTPARLARYVIELRILLLANIELLDRKPPVSSEAFTRRADRLLSAYQKVPVSIRSADEELRSIRGSPGTERGAEEALKLAEERLACAFSRKS